MGRLALFSKNSCRPFEAFEKDLINLGYFPFELKRHEDEANIKDGVLFVTARKIKLLIGRGYGQSRVKNILDDV